MFFSASCKKNKEKSKKKKVISITLHFLIDQHLKRQEEITIWAKSLIRKAAEDNLGLRDYKLQCAFCDIFFSQEFFSHIKTHYYGTTKKMPTNGYSSGCEKGSYY